MAVLQHGLLLFSRRMTELRDLDTQDFPRAAHSVPCHREVVELVAQVALDVTVLEPWHLRLALLCLAFAFSLHLLCFAFV